jgi:hypothetical protein
MEVHDPNLALARLEWSRMYYIANGQVLDDDRGLETAPPYALGARGERIELGPSDSNYLMQRFLADKKSRLPIGDLVAAAARGVGIEACEPCKRRQSAFNRFGDSIAGWFSVGR